LLIDEADNLDLFDDRKMRQIVNYGHETSGANIGRFKNGRPQRPHVAISIVILGCLLAFAVEPRTIGAA
jgi:hypothetical protein